MKRFTSDDRNEEGRDLIPARRNGEATTVDPSFDAEVGGPANGAMSRRQALGMLGGTLASAALISTVPGVAREAITAPALPIRPWSIEGSGSLVVAQVDAVRLHAFMIGLDDQIRHNEQSDTAFGGSWSGWNFLSKPGDRAKKLVVATHTDGRLHAFMIGPDDQIRHNEQSSTAFGSFWSGWNFLSKPGDKAKTPGCTP